jgi:hypothetical protein
MMRFSKVSTLVAVAVCFLAAAKVFSGQDSSPVGVWQFSITGSDRGVAFLTFSNDFNFAGYGISRNALGPFTIAGTWDFDAKGDVVAGYTQFIDAGSVAGTLSGRIFGKGRFHAKAKTTDGHQKFQAPTPAEVDDISGSWVGEVSSGGQKALESFTLTASTNMAGWFDLAGTGVGESGSFTVTGAVLVTSDNRIGAFTVSDFGTATETASFAGKLVKKGKKFTLSGENEDRNDVILRAERP